MVVLLASLAVSLALTPAQGPAPDPLKRFIDPLAAARPAPRVTVDTTAAPEAAPWAKHAAALAAEWFPHICQLLDTTDFKAPTDLKLVLKPDIGAPAYAGGSEITVDSKWVAAHPDDFGIIIHEMTHLIQAYPNGGNKPGWLVEGIADYIRWWRYEPEAPRPRIDPERSKVTDSYRTTAAFLAWAVHNHERSLVRRLDGALRRRRYTPALWERVTGKTLEALWTEYAATLPRSRQR